MQPIPLSTYCSSRCNIVITGGTGGLGLSLVKKLSADGNNVIFTSRYTQNINTIMNQIKPPPHASLLGVKCDVSKAHQVRNLCESVKTSFNTVDVWINNAASSDSFRDLCELDDSIIHQIINTNLFGTIICTKHAVDLMSSQPGRGHIINLSGLGSSCRASQKYPVYGATKAGIAQFSKTIQKDLDGTSISLHVLSPGIMITKLLTENMPEPNLRRLAAFMISPEIVASVIVPRILGIVKKQSKSRSITFLTLPKIIFKACLCMRKFRSIRT